MSGRTWFGKGSIHLLFLRGEKDGLAKSKYYKGGGGQGFLHDCPTGEVLIMLIIMVCVVFQIRKNNNL